MKKITNKQLEVIATYMDDETREQVHQELAPCSPNKFLSRYLELNQDIAELLETEFRITL